jgi:SAM-dependent methyltransferase
MDHADHVALIRGGVEGAGPRWLELGAGRGAFTLALADLLGPTGEILATDRDLPALRALATDVRRRFPEVPVATQELDFRKPLPPELQPFDGILAANALHFAPDVPRIAAALRMLLRPGGRLVVVEYDADHGNPWVPYPFSFDTWRRRAADAGYDDTRPLHRVPSRFLGGIYGAVSTSA